MPWYFSSSSACTLVLCAKGPSEAIEERARLFLHCSASMAFENWTQSVGAAFLVCALSTTRKPSAASRKHTHDGAQFVFTSLTEFSKRFSPWKWTFKGHRRPLFNRPTIGDFLLNKSRVVITLGKEILAWHLLAFVAFIRHWSTKRLRY